MLLPPKKARTLGRGLHAPPPFRDSVSRRLRTSAVLGDGHTMLEEDAGLVPKEVTTQRGDERLSM